MRSEESPQDQYVRIPTFALVSVQLRHLASQIDNSILVPGARPGTAGITGLTEWVGSWHNQAISVGWDWGVVNSLIVLLSQKEIRTNIQLVYPDLSLVPPVVAQIHLLHWIELLPWRELAINDLLGMR